MEQGGQRVRREGGLTASVVQPIDEAYVLRAARLAGLELASEQLPGVVEHLRRTAEAAQLVNDFLLGMNEEPGPIWRP